MIEIIPKYARNECVSFIGRILTALTNGPSKITSEYPQLYETNKILKSIDISYKINDILRSKGSISTIVDCDR